jgi:hypothetical protein
LWAAKPYLPLRLRGYCSALNTYQLEAAIHGAKGRTLQGCFELQVAPPGYRRPRRHFEVTERGSTLGREVKAGVVTFLTASYILLVNPQILGLAGAAPGGRG